MNTQLISVPFHGQSLLATLVNDIPHVALKPICENMGVDWKSQHRKITSHPVLKSTMVMMTTVAEDGKMRDMLMLPVKFINGWLFGIDSNRVKPEIQQRLVEYQTECFEVLANHFMPKEDVAKHDTLADLLKPITAPIPFAQFETTHRALSEALKNLLLVPVIVAGKEESDALNRYYQAATPKAAPRITWRDFKNDWSAEEIKLLLALTNQGLTRQEIYRQMPQRTPQAIGKKLTRLITQGELQIADKAGA